jgi:PhnB protein
VTFEEQGSKTKVTLHAKAAGFVDFAARMLAGMEPGWTESLDKLEELVLRTRGQAANDEVQIRNILADRTYALFGKRTDLAVKYLADDVVSYDLPPPLQFTGPAARDQKTIQQWFDTWEGPITWSMHDLNIKVGGDLAHAHGLGHMTGTKVGGEQVDVWVRCTACFGKEDGAWKITHQHTSVPFHMDGSYKAAVDLKPNT